MAASVNSRLLREPEPFFGFEEAADRVEAGRDERARADPGEGARHQDRPQQPLGQALDPRGEVHGRADNGEVEAVGGANIAENDLAKMQADADSDLGLVAFPPSLV